MGGQENGNFPLLYLMKMALRRGWVVLKCLKTPLRNIKMVPYKILSSIYFSKCCSKSTISIWPYLVVSKNENLFILWPKMITYLHLVGFSPAWLEVFCPTLGNILFLILHRSNKYCLIFCNVQKINIEEKKGKKLFSWAPLKM